MKTLEEIKETLKNHKEEIRKEFKAEITGVFSSYVRGEEKLVSGIGFLVRFMEGRRYLIWSDLRN